MRLITDIFGEGFTLVLLFTAIIVGAAVVLGGCATIEWILFTLVKGAP